MIEMTWENLRRFLVFVKEHGSDSPYIGDGETSITIDGEITREDLERFVAEQEGFVCEHNWVDVSTHNIEPSRKRECCTTCGEKREIDR